MLSACVRCEMLTSYKKHKTGLFHVVLADGSIHVYSAPSDADRDRWVQAICAAAFPSANPPPMPVPVPMAPASTSGAGVVAARWIAHPPRQRAPSGGESMQVEQTKKKQKQTKKMKKTRTMGRRRRGKNGTKVSLCLL
jgi:hypothetical protein